MASQKNLAELLSEKASALDASNDDIRAQVIRDGIRDTAEFWPLVSAASDCQSWTHAEKSLACMILALGITRK